MTVNNLLVNIGFGNVVAVSRIVAVVNPGSAPVRKMREEARDRGKVVDATEGRKTRSILITDSDHIILSALQVETLVQRIAGPEGGDLRGGA
ncbi:MAG TPA: DUF370 domain-containing protein [Dissulfurispiraceae bacterium]|nr:DUF370 domain-containing protein [Dissulfurispiraceae bacterium]